MKVPMEELETVERFFLTRYLRGKPEMPLQVKESLIEKGYDIK